jgi:chromosome segregation ATPase
LQDALAQAQRELDQLKQEKNALFERNLDIVKSTDRLRAEVIESEQKIKRKDAEILLLNMEISQRESELDDIQRLARLAARFRRDENP